MTTWVSYCDKEHKGVDYSAIEIALLITPKIAWVVHCNINKRCYISFAKYVILHKFILNKLPIHGEL